MDKCKLVNLLCELNTESKEPDKEDEEFFQTNYQKVAENLVCSYDGILNKIPSIANILAEAQPNSKLKYVLLNFYILELLNDELSSSNMAVLSVQETKNAKMALRNLLLNGILKNIQPKLPHFAASENSRSDETDVFTNYTLLKCTTFGFYHFTKYPNLRMLILPHFLQGMLVAIYQIACCPIKKPSQTEARDKFVMTEEMYTKLLHDQQVFKDILEKMSYNIHPSILIKETMILFQASAPIWFKKSISKTLTKIVRSPKGVQNIASAMLSGSEDDTTKTWKTLDVLTKLIINCRKFPDFKENICSQVLNLLYVVKSTDHDLIIFERLVVSCTKCLYSEDEELCNAVFIGKIMTPLLNFAFKGHQFRDGEDVTDNIIQSVRLLYGCFTDSSLPINMLKIYLNVLFHFYHLTVKSTLETTKKELTEILIKYLHTCTSSEIYELLDNFIFGFTVKDVLQFRDDLIVEIDEKIIVKNSPYAIIYTTADVADTVFNLLDTDQKIILFGYLLKCITIKEKYFSTFHNSKELLIDEDHVTGTVLERFLTIHKILSQLSEDKEVQRSLKKKPDDIIEYVNTVLSSSESDDQLVFLVLMILDNLIINSSPKALPKYHVFIKSLTVTMDKSNNDELKSLCNKIIMALREEKVQNQITPQKEKTEFEKALEDVSDPLLPTRGHGLLTLSKLIEKKDKEAVERKQYLLNLFQLHLKDEDSFIYLNAVQGLAALADTFADTILETLCEEYSDFSKRGKGGEETRMKLGEVLVRVTKILGEMAPKYKALLLNTFLSGTKDDDYLIRASSLSNLGEVCRVLNYKLGTIVTEVLVCVHAIIATDKAVEARRAAVTIIRQLFVGLQSEMISFLKEDILPVYRTLKEIYHNDQDDVMRLQAQLALEELNENMKSFVFPNPELSFEKKVVMLN